MGDEIVPIETSSWSDVLQELNIPKLIAGPAGEAISRLVGHAVDIPSEYVKNIKQGIQDKREARSEVSKALARAAATEVAADKELVHRAAQSFLAKELRSQANKEAVAKKAIEHLSHKSEQDGAKAEAPEEDWLNAFERYAENASSERLRDLWARVLAKEIGSPKTFSLRTMRFVSELDVKTASRFQEMRTRVFNGSYLLKPTEFRGQLFVDWLALEAAGLITGVDGNISQGFALPGTALKFAKSAVRVTLSGPIDFRLPIILLTDVGAELIKIVDSSDDDIEFSRELAEKFPKEGNITNVKYGRMSDDGQNLIEPIVVVWEADVGSSQSPT
jgi:hypothetical protein